MSPCREMFSSAFKEKLSGAGVQRMLGVDEEAGLFISLASGVDN